MSLKLKKNKTLKKIITLKKYTYKKADKKLKGK